MSEKILLKRQQFISILTAFLVLLQIPLWIGNGSIFSLFYTYYQQYQIIQDNGRIRLANNEMMDKLMALKNSTDEANARARLELGLVGKGETYYQVVK